MWVGRWVQTTSASPPRQSCGILTIQPPSKPRLEPFRDHQFPPENKHSHRLTSNSAPYPPHHRSPNPKSEHRPISWIINDFRSIDPQICTIYGANISVIQITSPLLTASNSSPEKCFLPQARHIQGAKEKTPPYAPSERPCHAGPRQRGFPACPKGIPRAGPRFRVAVTTGA